MDQKLEFAFSRKNYLLLLISIVIVVLGYALLSGGGSEDPNVFLGDYSLDEASFEQLGGEFSIDQQLIAKLEGLKGVVFASETELMEAITEKIGKEAIDANYFNIRSSFKIDAAMFSGRRITLAPLVILFGYAFLIYAIMYRESEGDWLNKLSGKKVVKSAQA
jgi:hypothetical protein